MKKVFKNILMLLIIVVSANICSAQFEKGAQYQLAYSDTVSTAVDTVSRHISTTSNSLKDLFINTYGIIYLFANRDLLVSTDPTFPANKSFVYSLDSMAQPPIGFIMRNSAFFKNMYVKSKDGTLVTYYIALGGW